MKKLTLLATLAVAGCAHQQTLPAADTVAQIQALTRQVCSFVPTIVTVQAILLQDRFGAAGAVAQQICTAITTQPRSQGPSRRPPMVNGVIIKGQFVRGR